MTSDKTEEPFPRGYAEHRRRQIRIGLAMTYAERLAWLEETKATMARWCGRARTAGLASAHVPGDSGESEEH